MKVLDKVALILNMQSEDQCLDGERMVDNLHTKLIHTFRQKS